MDKKRFLYLETDDTCAICGIRGVGMLTIHHIDDNHDNNAYYNTIILCYNCHRMYNDERGLTREQIEIRKGHLIEKTLTQYGINALKIAARNDFGVIAMPFLLYHLVELGFMRQEEIQATYGENKKSGREIVATRRFAITNEGRALLKKLNAFRKNKENR